MRKRPIYFFHRVMGPKEETLLLSVQLQQQNLSGFLAKGGRPTRARILVGYAPKGIAIATAHGHIHVDPNDQSHNAWMNAANNRPPSRHVEGYAEWDLEDAQTLSQRALSYGRPSRDVLLVLIRTGKFCDDTQQYHHSYWVNPKVRYGRVGRPPNKNINNAGWDAEF